MRKKSNHGFTIVELLIAMAISSIVLLILNRCVLTGTKLFEKTNKDAKIQIELQQVGEYISNVLLEAKEIKEETYGDVKAPSGMEKRYILLKNSGKACVFIYTSKDLTLKTRMVQVSLTSEEENDIRLLYPAATKEQLEQKMNEKKKEKLKVLVDRSMDGGNTTVLSNHVNSDFSISWNATTKVWKLNVSIEKGGKGQTCTKQVKPRNS